MTKYQRGELMEGWNDCPLPVSTSNNGAASSSATLKARKRMSRLPVVGSLPGSNESTNSGSSRSLMMPPIPSAMPVPSKGVSKLETGEVHASEQEEMVDFAASEAKLRALVENAEISVKEREFFTKRLVDAFPSLAAQHKKFITLIVDGVEAKEASSGLKSQVLNYMMVNSGVSTWGVPLKKLVETFK